MTPYPKPEKKVKEKNPMSKVSKKRKSSLALYKKVRVKYLTDFPKCEVRGCNRFSSEIHHKKGRVGDLLCDTDHFLGCCNTCHQKIEMNPEWAKNEGYSESRLEVNDMENYLK
jgi:hypothetical protein